MQISWLTLFTTSLKQIIIKLLKYINAVLIACILSGFLLLPASLYARDQPLNFNQQIERLKTAKKVTVVLSRPDVYSGKLDRLESLERYEGDNLRLRRMYGCNFASENRQKIKKLVDSLREQGITTSEYHHLPYATITIYFNDANDHEVRLSFGRQYLNKSTVDGEMELPTQDAPLKLSIGKDVYRDVYNWASNEAQLEQGLVIDGYWWVSESDMDRLNGCKIITNKNYYRNNLQQICSSSEFERILADECPTGWQPFTQK